MKEIEKKYLVIDSMIPDLSPAKCKLIEQHYVSLDESGKLSITKGKPSVDEGYFAHVICPEEIYLEISEAQYGELGGSRNVAQSEEARIRKKGETYFLTIKGDGTLERDEFETEISKEIFESLVPAAMGRTIMKERYEINLPGGKKAELDIYHGKIEGHKTVEVEFENEGGADSFKKPDWFGEDITKDKRYKNKNLAVNGWPQN